MASLQRTTHLALVYTIGYHTNRKNRGNVDTSELEFVALQRKGRPRGAPYKMFDALPRVGYGFAGAGAGAEVGAGVVLKLTLGAWRAPGSVLK